MNPSGSFSSMSRHQLWFHTGKITTSIKAASRDPMPSSGFLGHLYLCACTHTETQRHTTAHTHTLFNRIRGHSSNELNYIYLWHLPPDMIGIFQLNLSAKFPWRGQWEKHLLTSPEVLNSIPENPMTEGENQLLQADLWPPHAYQITHAHTVHLYTLTN